MSRWKLYDNWYADLAGLTVEQLRERRAFAAQRAQEAAARGMGRNSKAARDWRARLRAVDDELVGRRESEGVGARRRTPARTRRPRTQRFRW
ncbi:hypothetical protein [Streptomyces sp. NPDC052015]|uniref:hypothetical protein n=1 Tax=Streptomyces sp. NPDC052015 TaxID=3154755 RepID=UPI003449F756